MVYQRIRYFLKTADEESFSAAAAQLYITPQALTKQIGLLENEIGGKLFVRSPQGIKLTPLGEYAKQQFTHLDQEMENTFSNLRARAEDERPEIRIGIASALPNENRVMPFITFVFGLFPHFRIKLDLVEFKEGREKFLRGALDLLLTNTHDEEGWDGPVERLVFEKNRVQVMVSILHPWGIKKEITLEDLAKETFIKLDMSNDHYNVDVSNSFYANIPCRNIRTAGNFSTLLALLQQGEGFAVMPMAFSNMDRSHIRGFEYPGPSLYSYMALVYHTDVVLPEVLQIVEAVKEEFDLQVL